MCRSGFHSARHDCENRRWLYPGTIGGQRVFDANGQPREVNQDKGKRVMQAKQCLETNARLAAPRPRKIQPFPLFQACKHLPRPLRNRLLAFLLLLAWAAAGCQEPTIETPIRPVRTIRVGDVAEISGRSFPGRAQATEEVNLSFRVAGPLKEFPVKVGDEVTEGQLLAKIDPRDFDVAAENTRSNWPGPKRIWTP